MKTPAAFLALLLAPALLALAQTVTPGGQLLVSTVTNAPAPPLTQPVPTRFSPKRQNTNPPPAIALTATNAAPLPALPALPAVTNPAVPAALPALPSTVPAALAPRPAGTNATAPGTLPALFAPALTPPAGKADTIRPAAAAPATIIAAPPAATAPPVPGAMPAKPPAVGLPALKAAGAELPDKVIPAGVLKFVNTPLEQVLEYYAELVGRTIIRSPAVQGATQINLKSQTDLTVEEAVQALDSLLTLNSIAMIPVGEKFVTAIPTAQALQEAAAFSSREGKDLPEAGQYLTKILQLTHAKPSEVIAVIQPFAKMQGGILAIDSTQVLIIRDYAANIKRMLEIIEKIDIAVPLDENMEVIPIKYALASEISSVLGSLTTGGAVAGATAGRTTTGSSRTTTGGRRTGTGTGALGVTTGTLATPGQPQPGQPGFNPQQTGLQAGQQTSAFQQQLQRIVGAAAGSTGGAPLLGQARIIPYERNNALLIIGTPQEIKLAISLIEKLDRVQPQVLIEAIIMEVKLDDGQKTGVSFGQKAKSYNSTASGTGASKNGTFLGSLTTNALSLGSLPDGFSYFGNLGSAWEVALTAIATDSTINVLSRPRIQTSHAETATLFIGDTVPYVTGTYFGGVGGQATSQYTQKEIGITLSVLPIINDDGLVVMDIVQNIEQISTSIKIDNNDVPQTSKRNAQAKVAVRNGETIMLGGFISSQKTKSRSGVPFLKDIPYLGAAFRSDSDTTKRVELIVLLRPTVLKDPTDAAVAATQERDKLSGVKRAELEMLDEEKRLAERNIAEIIKRQQQDAERRK